MRITTLNADPPATQPIPAAATTFAALVVPNVAPAPANPIAALIAIPVTLINTAIGLVNAVINAVLAPVPGTSPDSPLLWAVLAAVRRQLFNQTPEAVNDGYSTSEGSGLTVPAGLGVLVNDNDADADPLIATVVSGPAHGDLVFNPDGTFGYTPDANFNGTDSFTYTVTDQTGGTHIHGLTGLLNLFTLGAFGDDGHSATAPATVTITVTAVDDAPVAVGDIVTVAEDSTATVIPVLSNDTDVDGGPRTVTAVTQPGHGTVTVIGTAISYTPAANFNGTDTFGYTLNGGSTATVTVTVTAADDAPVAVGDIVTVVEDSAATVIPVLVNDTDVDGDPKTITAATQPGHGAVTFTDTAVSYTPAANFFGTETFDYTLNGGSTATVTVTVTAVDDVPVAADDAVSVVEDSAATVIPVLVNDTDVDGGPRTITAVTQPGHGAVTFTDTAVNYTPAANFFGTETFGYTLNGGSTATVTVTVTAVDDVPVAADDAVTVAEDSTATVIEVLTNDTDVDGGPKTITAVTQPGHGAVTVTGTTLSYTPATNFYGTDTFGYTLNGGSTATVTVTVTAVNDGDPVIESVTSAPQTGNTWVVSVATSDVDGEPLTVAVTAVDAAHVTVTGNGGGPYTVTVTDAAWARANAGAQIAVVVTATDGHGLPVSTTKTVGTVSNVVAVGWNVYGQSAIPALPPGMTYTQIDAGGTNSVLLRSDGTVINVGNTANGLGAIPVPPAGVFYTQVAAGGSHTVLLRSDGTAVGVGSNNNGQTSIPAPPAGLSYTQVAAGGSFSVLLLSDGSAIKVEEIYFGESNEYPALPAGVTYVQAAAGADNTLLLRSDGLVDAFGSGSYGKNAIPALPTGVKYTQVAAGQVHTVLLRSDGTAVAVGDNSFGELNIPALPAGVKYTQVATGNEHTVLLRSDGVVVALGLNSVGQTNVPGGTGYTAISAGAYHTLLFTAVSAPTTP
ncbi:Ig-like domain-containing protein [Mycolicibacterium sp. GCM10028919]|uniref:Ig-like domain-containing protein n=1 Tax=Mycolicibacterium sp. GCM10028919 TaxID=3273401 RepID=UPI00360601EE